MKKLFLVLAAVLSVARPVVAQTVPPSPQTVSVVDSGTQCSVAGSCAQWDLSNGVPSFTIQVTGTLTTVTLTFRASADGISFFDIQPTKLSTGVAASTTTTTGQYAFLNTGLTKLRVVGTIVTSGAANITLTRGSATSSARAFPSFGSFATGDVLYASATNTISGLADVAAGSYLRSGGVGSAPLWSTLTLPNAATTGDILSATSANTVGNLAAVAVGQVLASAGTGTAPAYTATPSVTSITVKPGGAAGAGTMKAMGVVCQDVTNPDTATQNAWNYKTCTVPAAALAATGDSIECFSSFRFATNGNTKAWQLWVNGGTCSGSGATACGTGNELYANSTTGSAIRTQTLMTITKTGSNAQAIYGSTQTDISSQTDSVPGTATESGSIPIVLAYRNESASAATTNTNIAPVLVCKVANF